MASITEILMNMASQQAKTAGQQQENQYASIRNQFAPEGFRLQNELTAGQVKKIPAEIRNLLADAAYREIETKYAPTKYDIERQNANTSSLNANISNRAHSQEQLDAQLENLKSMIKYRNTPGQQNRGLSPVSKLLREADAAEENGDIESANLLRQTAQKAGRDPVLFRAASEYQNVLENLNSIPIESLSQYAGYGGKGKSIAEGIEARFGKNSPEYTEFYNFTHVQLPFIAEDIRRALRTSITPEMQQYINNFSDPIKIDSNPELAISSWNTLKKLIANQAKTYYKNISGPVDFKGEAKKLEEQSVTSGEGGQKKTALTPEQAQQLLAQRKRKWQ
jgi:hypothetical protein